MKVEFFACIFIISWIERSQGQFEDESGGMEQDETIEQLGTMNVTALSSEKLLGILAQYQRAKKGEDIVIHYRTFPRKVPKDSEVSEECRKAKRECTAVPYRFTHNDQFQYLECPSFCQYAYSASPCFYSNGTIQPSCVGRPYLRRLINPCSTAMQPCFGISVIDYERMMHFTHPDQF